jgi:hypothetical protein
MYLRLLKTWLGPQIFPPQAIAEIERRIFSYNQTAPQQHMHDQGRQIHVNPRFFQPPQQQGMPGMVHQNIYPPQQQQQHMIGMVPPHHAQTISNYPANGLMPGRHPVNIMPNQQQQQQQVVNPYQRISTPPMNQFAPQQPQQLIQQQQQYPQPLLKGPQQRPPVVNPYTQIVSNNPYARSGTPPLQQPIVNTTSPPSTTSSLPMNIGNIADILARINEAKPQQHAGSGTDQPHHTTYLSFLNKTCDKMLTPFILSDHPHHCMNILNDWMTHSKQMNSDNGGGGIEELGVSADVIARSIYELYDSIPLQCSTCGLRFRRVDELNTHLDHHYKISSLKGTHRVLSRKWYQSESDWIKETDKEVMEDPGAIFFKQMDEEKKLSEQQFSNSTFGSSSSNLAPSDLFNSDLYIEPVVANDQQTICPLCKDEFDTKFDDDIQEWIFVDAAKDRNTGIIAHRICLPTLLASEPQTPQTPLNDQQHKRRRDEMSPTSSNSTDLEAPVFKRIKQS